MTRQTKINTLLAQYNLSTEKDLQELLKKKYYSEVPLITDAEYDELFPKDYVGYTVDQNGPWDVLEHKIAMGSLNKLKTWEQAENWLKDKGQVVWEPKLDGLSMELVYERGCLKHAILRGGGDKGEDIFKNAINFKGVLPIINTTTDYVSIRGEVIISKSNFETLCKLSNESYSNRRNCVPGICRRHDGLYSNLLGFYAYDIIEDSIEFTSELQKIQCIFDYGFMLPFVFKDMTEAQYNRYGDIRDTAEDFQMDGLVIKTLDTKEQIALKFEPKGETTTVTKYTWEVGTTGKLVPTVWFETVNVGGSNLSKAAIGSFQGYIDLGASIGSIVEVRKMGDVIPKVTKVIKRNLDAQLEAPNVCPVCNSILQRQGTDLYCVNPDCRVKQEQKCCSVYNAVYLKGTTASWIYELMKQGKIIKCYDVLKVKAEDIGSLNGYSLNKGQKIVDNFKVQCKEILDGNILKFLWMLPIPTVAGKAQEKLASIFNSFAGLESWITEFSIDRHKQLVELLGNAKGTKAFDYFTENQQDIIKLIKTMKEVVNE